MWTFRETSSSGHSKKSDSENYCCIYFVPSGPVYLGVLLVMVVSHVSLVPFVSVILHILIFLLVRVTIS